MIRSSDIDGRRWAAWGVRLLLLAAAQWLATQASLSGPRFSSSLPMVWLPTGLAVAAMVRWGAGCAPALWAGLLLALWPGQPAGWVALGAATGSTAACWAAVHWLERAGGFDRQLSQRRDLWLLVSFGLLGGAMLSAAQAAVWMVLSGQVSPIQLPQAWFLRWLGEASGLLTIGVPLLTARASDWHKSFDPDRWPGSVALLILVAAALTGLLVLPPQALPLAVLALMSVPVLVCWLALRNGAAVASSATMTIIAVSGMAQVLQVGLPGRLNPDLVAWLVPAAILALSALVLLPQALQGELRRVEQRWQLALDGSDLGVAEWNPITGQSFTSPRWRALLADPEGKATDSLERWVARVHPEDRMPLFSALAPIQSPVGAGLRLEVRIQVQGGWCWFDLHIIVCERAANGFPQRVVASLSDIGSRRSAQDRQQLSSNLFMHLHEGLLITDADMRVLDANPTYSRITGVPLSELLGTVPSLLKPASGADRTGRVQHAAMWASLHTSGHWVGEVIDRRRNGDPCALQVTVSSVSGPDGGLRYHVLVVSDITEQRLQRERLERQAHFDELTRLPNRAHLGQLLADAMRTAETDGHLLAVCYFDLDRFKDVNERHGREAGDRLLAELAIRLRATLRARGALRADLAARLGGDEFVLLMHASSVEEVRGAVERVLRVVAQPFDVTPNGAPVVVTASIGVTIYPVDGSDADTLLRHADHAMFEAKQSGRNRHQFFDAEHRRLTEERALAIGRVQEALDQHELVLYYQPKVDLRRGVVLGLEALLRWNHPEHGVVAPAQFLPLIEHTGLSARIGDHVLAQALDQLHRWRSEGLDLAVSVNVSARHLQEPDFVQRLAELLARHPQRLGPHLELEVLETAALTDVGFTSQLLEQCARLGVRWALDDFGTGYSTLTYLKRLPVHVLKIDRSFVQNMLTDAQDRAIIEGVISLARTFDCHAVAEGIETAAQARMLLDIGCDIGQGDGIAAPMPADQVLAWVRSWRGLFTLSSTPAAPLQTGTRPPD